MRSPRPGPSLRRALALLLPLACAAPLLAQQSSIEVGDDVLVSVTGPRLPLAEPHLAANPSNPAHLLGTAIVVGAEGDSVPAADTWRCATFASFDAGASWTRADIPLGWCGDPWVAVLSDTLAVFTGLSEGGELLVFRSGDGGRTWPDPPLSLGRGHDHETMVVDTARGLLYLVAGRGRRLVDRRLRWVTRVARSRDGGRSFEHDTHVAPFVLNFESPNPVVLSDGTLVVPIADHHALDGRDIVDREWILLSEDGGRTFSEPMFVTDRCYGRGGWPSLAADASSGAFRDRIYQLCIAQDFAGVLLHASADRGESWDGPVRVDQAGDGAYAATPAMAVDENGVLGVAWYDLRADPARACMRIYFTASLDGGASFLPERVVSTEDSCPAAGANGAAAERFPRGGDYSGLVALGDGRFRILWADSRDGVYRLRSAEVRVRDALAREHP